MIFVMWRRPEPGFYGLMDCLDKLIGYWENEILKDCKDCKDLSLPLTFLSLITLKS